jgi:hypothetical protein
VVEPVCAEASYASSYLPEVLVCVRRVGNLNRGQRDDGFVSVSTDEQMYTSER